MIDSGMIKAFKATHVDSEALPWHPLTPYTDEVLLKVLHVDPVQGEVVAMLKVPGGANLGTHSHYGRVLAYTIQGSWRYAEHDWVASPGDFVYEVAGAQHTFIANPGDDVVVFFAMEGGFAFLDENGNTVGTETAQTMTERYNAYCAQHGIDPVDLTEFALS